VTAVVCMKAPSKESTANQRYAVDYWGVNSNRGCVT